MRVLVAAMALSCADRTSVPTVFTDNVLTASTTVPRDGRVVIVTIDGVRWQDVFEGSDPALGPVRAVPATELMPRSHELVATRGVALGATLPGCGKVRTAGGANMSLPGYQEIFTGHRSLCLDNRCTPVRESVLDQAARVIGTGAASIGSWEVLASAVSGGHDGVFVAVGRGWPGVPTGTDRLRELVAAGLASAPYPGNGAYRPDAATASIALEYYRAEEPRLFHIGLGDTDEYGHRGDYPAYLEALRYADSVIGELADLLDASALGEKTTVLITADHGRNADFRDHGLFHPESGRSFILAFGGGIPVRGVSCPTRDVTLTDLAPTVRVLLGISSDTGGGDPIELITEPGG